MSRKGRITRWGLPIAAALAAIGLVLPASSSATTFGTNLNRSPADFGSCFDIFYNASFGTVSAPSCSLEAQDLNTGESGYPPTGRGVVTTVRVRVGPETGPMQVVVEQALRQDNPSDPGHPTYACCQAMDASQVFTPTRNSVTAIPVNLPIRQDIAPDPQTGYYVDQHLVLSVLAPNVTFPLAADPNAFVGGWEPAWSVGQERVDHWGLGSGAIPLLNADWGPAGSAGTAKKCKKAKKRAAAAKKKKKRCKKKRKKRK